MFIRLLLQLLLTLVAFFIFLFVMPLLWVHHVNNGEVEKYKRMNPQPACAYKDPKGTGLVNPFCYDEKRDGPNEAAKAFQQRQQEKTR